MSAAVLSPPPKKLPHIALQDFIAGSVLHRTHDRAFRPAQFNPCRGQPTRFAPIFDAAGACIPSLYAATTREAAAYESIFHDIDARAAFKTVRLAVVAARTFSRLAPDRDLRLAPLFAPDLKVLGLGRAQLIETSKATYRQTAQWAQAIHANEPGAHGLIWTSRQCDPDRCILLFGDRVGETDFRVLESLDVAIHAYLLLEVRGYGRRAGIDIVH